MIAPMKRVYLVLLEQEKVEGLKALRKLGLVHVETSQPGGPEYSELQGMRDLVAKALNIIPAGKKPGPGTLSVDKAIELAKRIVSLEESKPQLQTESGSISQEIERASVWGDFDPAVIDELASKGINLSFYETDPRSYDEAMKKPPENLGPGIDIVVLHRDKKSVRLAVISRGEEGDPLPVPSSFIRFELPEKSIEGLRSERAGIEEQLKSIDREIGAASAETASLKTAGQYLDQEISFATVRGSFSSDGPVSYVKGYVPADGAAELEKLARERSWALIVDDVTPEDATPTKVVLNRFTSMMGPVFDFLGVVPGYYEYEISPYFLIFFSFFSAMIFGDGAYGLIMLIGCLIAALKSIKAGKKPSDAIRLFTFIAAMTFFWGMFTCTWFSIKAANLPKWLVNLSIWPISSANPDSSKNIQIFCFLLGVLQLSIARIKNIIHEFPNPKFIAQVGGLALVWGMLFLVLNLVVDSKRFPLPSFTVALVGGGFAATVLFANYDGNLLKSIVEGLKSIIPTFLSSVGVFADIVSYIRLWALGLAGSSLASIINNMASGMFKPIFMAGAGVLLLVFGHTLNVVLNVLSVVVHAVRLNILEFSCNHLGMQWSGIKYEPFRVTYQQDKQG